MRRAQIQQTLKNHELDGILLTTYENRRYVSGFTGSDGAALITRDDAVLLVDGRYTQQARLETEDFTVIEFISDSYKHLKNFGLKNLCIEDKSLPLSHYKRLKELLTDTHFHNGSWIVDEMRSIKSENETEKMKKAAEISDKAFEHIMKFVEIGMTEKEIAVEIEFFMRKNGAEGVSFDAIVASSARSALPHAQPTDRKIEHGDVLLMDFGCIYEGYCSDITRTVFIGDATKEQVRVYETVLAAQLAGLESIAGGIRCADVDKAARDLIEAAGFGTNFTHSLGHGVGLNVHELPVLSPRSDKVLKTGNTVTVEPGIYLQNQFGVRIEDLVVVTDDGFHSLTQSPKDLIII